MGTELGRLIEEHRPLPFPESIDKSRDYGDFDLVLVDFSVHAWAVGVAEGTPLDAASRDRLQRAHDFLIRSMDTFPEQAQPYFRLVARLAAATLAHDEAPPESDERVS
jgi:hypothetical protein